MKNDKTVTINGQKYDSVTGLPIAKSTTVPKNPNSIKSVGSLSQKSKDLYARVNQKKVNQSGIPIRKIGRSMDIAKSKSVSRFAPRSTTASAKPKSTIKSMDIGPIKHPLAAKVEKARLASKNKLTKPAASKTAKAIKEEVIAKALDKATIKKTKNKSFLKRNSKFINIFSVSIILLVLIGFITYKNIPGVSVRIASAQAGISATYPEYLPDGYRIDGPVKYTDGVVNIYFSSNTGNGSFVISQSKSSWDSSAVKLQVDKDSNNESAETKESGLTIYTYDNNAAWVNGGILYTIKGDAPLSGAQIRHIATSL